SYPCTLVIFQQEAIGSILAGAFGLAASRQGLPFKPYSTVSACGRRVGGVRRQQCINLGTDFPRLLGILCVCHYLFFRRGGNGAGPIIGNVEGFCLGVC
ncbi:MAG: hypothetical protein LC775_18430, partial [Acidobacteria bacterium]|nr:hypothetical protein [Acidobacteriota bacterium]